MPHLYYTLGILVILFEICKAFLSKTEEKITLSVMNDLRISQCVLVTEKSDEKNMVNLKNFSFSNKLMVFLNTTFLNDFINYYIKRNDYFEEKIIIVLKAKKLSTVTKLFNKFIKLDVDHKIYIFTWLTFVDSSKSAKRDEKDLEIPMNCQFLLVRHSKNTEYNIIEIFKVQDQTFSFDYGTWSSRTDSLALTNLSWQQKRSDLKRIKIPLIGVKMRKWGRCHDLKSICAYYEFLDWLSSNMNFRIKQIKLEKLAGIWDFFDDNDIAIRGDLVNVNYLDSKVNDEIEVSGPIFKQNLNWFIRRPVSSKHNDFFIHPFETSVWIILFITIISSGIILVSLQLSHPSTKNFEFTSNMFTPLDCFTNQDGNPTLSELSLRIFIYTIRFIALFVVGSYLATLSSFMAVEILQIPFKNPKELVENGKYVLEVSKTNKAVRAFLEQTREPYLMEIQRKFYKLHTGGDLAEKVCDDKTVLVYYNSKRELEDLPCKIYQLPIPIKISWSVFVMPKNSPIKKIFDSKLIQFYSTGIRQKIYQTYFTSEFEPEKRIVSDSIELLQISQILIIMLSGLLLAIIICFIECALKCCFSKCHTNEIKFETRRKIKRGAWVVIHDHFTTKANVKFITFCSRTRQYEEAFGALLFIRFSFFLLIVVFSGLNTLRILAVGFNSTLPGQIPILGVIISFNLVSCMYGTIIMQKSYDIADAIYDIPWYEMSPRLRKYVLLIMNQAQHPYKLSAGPFFKINLASFSHMSKMVYELLMFCRPFIMKNEIEKSM